MAELLQEKKWFGAFFTNENEYDKRFSGELCFSPENGISLKYLSLERPDISNYLYGVLTSGEKCTLLGLRRYTDTIVPQVRHGVESYPGTVNFSYLFVGDYLDEDLLLESVDFSLTNLQEFFFSEYRKDFVQFKDLPLLNIKTDYGCIKIRNEGVFENVHKQKTLGLFYSKNRDQLDGFQSCLNQLSEEYPDSRLMIKKEISYRVKMEFDSGVQIRNAYQHIVALSDLFSILLYCPVFPEEIKARKKTADLSSLSVFPSTFRVMQNIELGRKRRLHNSMSITYNNINLSKVITKWLERVGQFSTLVSSIQRNTGYIDLHSAYGEFILYATQLEAINKEDSQNSNVKYTYPIHRYASKEVRECIEEVFSKAGEPDIGRAISCLRGELAHVNRPQKLLNILSFHDVASLCQYLQMTVLGFALEKLGLDRTVISQYQNQIIR